MLENLNTLWLERRDRGGGLNRERSFAGKRVGVLSKWGKVDSPRNLLEGKGTFLAGGGPKEKA